MIISLFCCSFHVYFVVGVMLPDEQRLVNELFNKSNYDNTVRPVMNASYSVEVKFGFTLIQIMDMVSPAHVS